MKNFMAGMDFFGSVAEVAEADGHHPDLHLEGYRNVWIELWTHAIGGLVGKRFYPGRQDRPASGAAQAVTATFESLARRFHTVSTPLIIASHSIDLVHPRRSMSSSMTPRLPTTPVCRTGRTSGHRRACWPNALPPSAAMVARCSNWAVELDWSRSLRRTGFNVLATDYSTDALEFTAANAAANNIRGVTTRLIDLRSLPDDLGTFDVVAASDVLYERPLAALVASIFDRCLKPDGWGMLTDPGRRVALPFAHECEQFGLEADFAEQVDMPEGERTVTVDVFEIRRLKSARTF